MTCCAEKKYNKLPLTLCVAGGLLLFFSWWLCPFINMLWQNLDDNVFLSLNKSLGTEKNSWNLFWAIANYRAFDLLAAVFMFIILFVYALNGSGREDFKKRIAVILGSIIYVVIASQIMKLFTMKIDRPSASKIHHEVTIFLSELYPAIDPKDASSNSFPGDHAIILFGFMVAMFYYGKIRYGIPALIVALVFAFPRIIGGAHWLTDILIGSGFITLVIMGIYVNTPVHSLFERASQFILGKIPLVNWFTSIVVRDKKEGTV